MSTNPLNLALRFVLEIAALVSAGVVAWDILDGWWRWLGVIGAPLALAAMWGTFAVPNDPSRSGSAPIPVSGSTRLVVEFVFFLLPVVGLVIAGRGIIAGVLAGLVIFHYALSWDRIEWLLHKG